MTESINTDPLLVAAKIAHEKSIPSFFKIMENFKPGLCSHNAMSALTEFRMWFRMAIAEYEAYLQLETKQPAGTLATESQDCLPTH